MLLKIKENGSTSPVEPVENARESDSNSHERAAAESRVGEPEANGANGHHENGYRPVEQFPDLNSLADFIGQVAAENKLLPKIIREAKRTIELNDDSTIIIKTIAHFYSLAIAKLLLTQSQSFFCLRQPIFSNSPDVLGSMLLVLSGRLRPEDFRINTEVMMGAQAALLLKNNFGQILTRAYQRNLEAYDELRIERAKPLSRAINQIALRGKHINEIFASVIKDLEPTLTPKAKFGELPLLWLQELYTKAPPLRAIEFTPSKLEKTAREIVAGMIKRQVLADHPNPSAADFYNAATQAVLFAPESLFILKDILRNPDLPEEVRLSLREWVEGRRFYPAATPPEGHLASKFLYSLQQCIDDVAKIFVLERNFGAGQVSQLANTPKGTIDYFNGLSDYELQKLVGRVTYPDKPLGLSLVSRLRDRKQLKQIPRAQYFLVVDELARTARERQDKALLDPQQLDDYLQIHDILDRLPGISTQYHLEQEEIEQSAREAARNLLAVGEIAESIGEPGKLGQFFNSVFKQVFNNAESPFSLKCMSEDYDHTKSCRQILEAYRQFVEQPSLVDSNGLTPEQQIALRVSTHAKQYLAELSKQLLLQARFGVEDENELPDSKADRVKAESKSHLLRFLRRAQTPKQQFTKLWQPIAGYLAVGNFGSF